MCFLCVFFFFLRQTATPSTGCFWHSSEASGAAELTIHFFFPLALLSCYLHIQCVLEPQRKMYLQLRQLREVTEVKRRRRKKRERHKRRLDVLTEGVSFSSDLSLSPCSKNSLVTNSATWSEREDI